MTKNVDQLSINTIRTLSIDSIEKANSGHPGMPMGAAPMAYKVFTEFMQHNPANPNWFNRDRFVLSAGHGSMLLYSLLHLQGYDVTLDDLKNFRQWGSRTPGHPEFGHTPGVEATTGPLGQGFAMSVGFAMAEAHLGATFNKEGYPLVDHYTYSICGDGDLMEGVSAEAASLAGHLQLGKLIVLYDSNDISLDGDLHESFSESVEDRFKAYGWQVIRVEDGNDLDAITKAVAEAKQDSRPTMIEVKTVIGYGSPNKSGKSASHGAPLGKDEVTAAKEAYSWDYEEEFHIPEEVKAHFDELKKKGAAHEEQWNKLLESYKKDYPELGEQFENAVAGKLPEGWDSDIPVFEEGDSPATRASSGDVINAIAPKVPQFFGGSADLASSTKTMMKGEDNFSRDNYAGRNIWFGVREFAMAAAVNGMSLHGGLKPFGATFFVFSDYLRPALRLSALMQTPATFVFTHDSIAVGEDGPTHEPIEQLPALRAMPGLSLIRPGDANETAAAWRLAMESNETPHALVLTRQGLPTLPETKERAEEGVRRGGYVVSDANGEAQGLLLATGSEVSLAVETQKLLEKEGIHTAVVSMPSWDRFDQQSDDYKESVLPSNVTARLAMEVASPLGWERYTGIQGDVLGINTFGASAPGGKIMEEYGFTPENAAARFKKLLNK
ncbi:transketolase [Alkalicoccus urumqiensis]|uniref:Transketolase n=1 Tax=Alkalicoccus urumqiensis TaxID=1548213 RepID=A0A2P6MDX2_ALKUR|nr:transketolase [Alkalicoccus urumqiensis]PRO64464.1 transketolase [Alkalicoccus urumqiensis]